VTGNRTSILILRRRTLAGAAWIGLLLCGMAATAARADMVLLSDTTLVTGNRSSVYSFSTPAAGTVTVQLTNLAWPQALSNLSFMASTPTNVLSSWFDPSLVTSQSTTNTLTFQVASSGAYFADVMATAGGSLDLGLYSLSLTFAPAGTVPLPASGWLLAGALVLFVGLLWRGRAVAPAQTPGGGVL
jgi:hypothetical protein